MKKLLISVLLLGCASISYAIQPDFLVPVSVNGVSDPGLKSSGVEVCHLVKSSNAALVTDSDGNTITDGFVHWIIRPTTGAAGSFLELRATNTANLASARLIPQVSPVIIMQSSSTVLGIINFDPPLPFSGGLSVNTLPAGASGSVPGMEFGVGVRWKKQ